MRKRHSGVSIFYATGISLLIMAVALRVILSAQRSFEAGENLERANQVFYAAESGLEAALFHQNSRSRGIHFAGEDASLTLTHPNTQTTTKWQILGRDNPQSGLLQAFERVEIPLFWDDSNRPTDPPPNLQAGEGAALGNHTFQVTWDGDGIPTPNSEFNFGNDDNQVIVDWAFSRTHETKGSQTFLPGRGFGTVLNPCGFLSDFVCESGSSNRLPGRTVTIASTSARAGVLQPCPENDAGCVPRLDAFLSDPAARNFQLSFQSLAPLVNTDSFGVVTQKIPGIPYTVEVLDNGPAIPRPGYTITSEVTQGDFSRRFEFAVDHPVGIGSFTYVIFQ